jgi:beta-glucosidase
MPGRFSRYGRRALRAALAAGRLREDDLDAALRGLLRVMFEIGHIDEPRRPRRRGISMPEGRSLARELAAAGITLLRNEDEALPLDPSRLQRVAVLGPTANQRNCLPLWGGSAGVWSPEEITPARGLAEALRGQVEITDDPAGADAAVLFVGQSHRPGSDSEGVDRRRFALPRSQVDLIRETAAQNPRTIVVLVAGSPVEMEWAPRVSAILVAWYPGMEGGRAIADVLTGRVNPSAKLPVTFPRRLEHSPAHASPERYPGDGREVVYSEDVFVGYRHFDRAARLDPGAEAAEPLYPFGHGLSYTRFAYSDLRVEHPRWEGEGTLGVSFTLTNTGPRDGAEVVQLYVGDPGSSVPRPPRELRAFEKRFLRAGESARIDLQLRVRDLAWFCESPFGWRAEPGRFTLEVGASSRDLRLQGEVELVKDWFAPAGDDR